MEPTERKGLKLFLMYTLLIVAVVVLFTRMCFIADSKLALLKDAASWRTARVLLSGYFDWILPDYAHVDYGKATDVPRALFPRRIYFPLLHAVVPQNDSAYARAPQHAYVGGAHMIPTPFVMYAPAPGAVEFAGARVFHNAQQFRYPDDLVAKQPGEFRIFVTGGSTAWGAMAPDLRSTISAFMEEALNRDTDRAVKFRVINAAVGGYTTTHERIWIQSRVAESEPDLIISYSGFNDVFCSFVERRDLFNRLNDDADYYFAAVREYEFFNRGAEPVDHMRNFGRQFYDPTKFPSQSVANVDMVASYLRLRNVPFVFILQPVNKRAPNISKMLPGYSALADALRKDAAAGGAFVFINHADLFKDREHLFLDECHIGDLGNRIIAEDVLRQVRPLIKDVLDKGGPLTGVKR